MKELIELERTLAALTALQSTGLLSVELQVTVPGYATASGVIAG